MSTDHLQSLAQNKHDSDNAPFTLSEPLMAQIRFLWWILWGVAGAAVAVAIYGSFWIASVNERFTAGNRDRDDLRILAVANKAKIDMFDARFRSDDLVHLGQNQLIAAVQKELEDRKPLVAQVQEMYFLLTHGISNKDDFVAKHGGKP